METVRWKILTKNNSIYRSYQAQPMGWVYLIICTQISIRGLIQMRDEGRSQHLVGFSTWWLSILRMPLDTNMLCKRLWVYERLYQKWLGIHFLFLSKNDINYVLKIPIANFCRLNTPQSHPRHSRNVASWNFNCIWFMCPTFPESKSKVLLKLCIKLLTLVWNYWVCSQRS